MVCEVEDFFFWVEMEKKYVESWDYKAPLHMADKMEKPKKAAAIIRKRFLRKLYKEINSFKDPVAALWAQDILDEVEELDRRAEYVPTDNTNNVTEEMIEQATQVPIENIVEFTRGKAIAFCHDDNNPSMFHGTRTNQAICPVCGLSFNTIKVLMERDGMKFYDSVRYLCSM